MAAVKNVRLGELEITSYATPNLMKDAFCSKIEACLLLQSLQN